MSSLNLHLSPPSGLSHHVSTADRLTSLSDSSSCGLVKQVNLVKQLGSRPQADGLIQKFLWMLIQVQLGHTEYIRRGFWGKMFVDVGRRICSWAVTGPVVPLQKRNRGSHNRSFGSHWVGGPPLGGLSLQ